MQKPIKVLISADASTNATGLGKYSYELCKGLHNDPNYIVAEQANFSNESNRANVEWGFYPVEPSKDNQKDIIKYNQDPENRYGKWIFEKTLLDFKPDFVLAISDPWMFAYQGKSLLREYYHWIISPTIDSFPQKEDYLSIYSLGDSIVTYTDWAMNILEEYNIPNLVKTIRMGVDTNIFKPVQDKGNLKEQFGIPKDAFIIGSVMRNQTRKLIPDLIEAFNIFMDSLSKEDQQKTFLYLHTTYPDIECWDIPKLILESKYSKQLLFTYKCNSTNEFGCSTYQDSKTYSFASNALTLFLPSGRNGLSNLQLSDVYNLFDLYIQLASCEGFGVPIIEASACGVNCAVIDYSAMKDAADNLDLYKIKSFNLYHDNNNGCKRAKVNAIELAKEIEKLVKEGRQQVNQINKNLVEKTKNKYSWDKCIELWKSVLTKDRLVGAQGKWDSPRKEIQIKKQYPTYLSNSELLEWLYENLYPSVKYKYNLNSLTILRHLHYGMVDGRKPQPFDRDKLMEIFTILAHNKNEYEKIRYEKCAI